MQAKTAPVVHYNGAVYRLADDKEKAVWHKPGDADTPEEIPVPEDPEAPTTEPAQWVERTPDVTLDVLKDALSRMEAASNKLQSVPDEIKRKNKSVRDNETKAKSLIRLLNEFVSAAERGEAGYKTKDVKYKTEYGKEQTKRGMSAFRLMRQVKFFLDGIENERIWNAILQQVEEPSAPKRSPSIKTPETSPQSTQYLEFGSADTPKFICHNGSVYRLAEDKPAGAATRDMVKELEDLGLKALEYGDFDKYAAIIDNALMAAKAGRTSFDFSGKPMKISDFILALNRKIDDYQSSKQVEWKKREEKRRTELKQDIPSRNVPTFYREMPKQKEKAPTMRDPSIMESFGAASRKRAKFERIPFGKPIPDDVWSNAIEILKRYIQAGEAWVAAGRPRDNELYQKFEEAETPYNEMMDAIFGAKRTPEQSEEWSRVSREEADKAQKALKSEASVKKIARYIKVRGQVYRLVK